MVSHELIGLKLVSWAVGKLPASQANPEVVTAFRREEREQTEKLLDKYMSICRAAKVGMFIVTANEKLINSYHFNADFCLFISMMVGFS